LTDKTLRVDPIACDGHGLCAELFPEWVELDEWGYPIIRSAPVPRGLEKHARRAVGACPTLALRLKAETRVAASGAPTDAETARRRSSPARARAARSRE
jgi:ferredoxin